MTLLNTDFNSVVCRWKYSIGGPRYSVQTPQALFTKADADDDVDADDGIAPFQSGYGITKQ